MRQDSDQVPEMDRFNQIHRAFVRNKVASKAKGRKLGYEEVNKDQTCRTRRNYKPRRNLKSRTRKEERKRRHFIISSIKLYLEY